MRISPVYNVDLLNLIKNHEGLSVLDIQMQDGFKSMSTKSIEKEVAILVGMGEITLTKENKYI